MSTIIEQLHALPWAEVFSHRALDKARSYAEEDRVTIRQIDDLRVIASCVGSEAQAYQQVIELSENRNGQPRLECVCSCPVMINCKHCAAVIYYLQDQPVKPSESAVQVHLNRELERWLGDIPSASTPLDESAQGTNTRLVYRLKATSASGKWTLEIFKARPLKDGRLQDLKALHSLSDMLIRQPGYLTELDLRITGSWSPFTPITRITAATPCKAAVAPNSSRCCCVPRGCSLISKNCNS